MQGLSLRLSPFEQNVKKEVASADKEYQIELKPRLSYAKKEEEPKKKSTEETKAPPANPTPQVTQKGALKVEKMLSPREMDVATSPTNLGSPIQISGREAPFRQEKGWNMD